MCGEDRFKVNRPLAKAHISAATVDDVPTLDTVPNDWLYKYESNLSLVDTLSPRTVKKKGPGPISSIVGGIRIVEIKV